MWIQAQKETAGGFGALGGGSMGGVVCDADSLLEVDHQQRGAQTHTYTLLQYVGLPL